MTAPGETVGLMLPNTNGAAIAFMALQAAGRVAAVLNFTAGAFNVIAACKTTNVRFVLCSREFVEKAQLGRASSRRSEAHVQFVWLEDLRDGATFVKSSRLFEPRPRARRHPSPDDPAVVLFTSGSEGAPKGVALSHANLLANVAQISARFDLTPADIVFNPLPMFHAFGLTGGRAARPDGGHEDLSLSVAPALPADPRTHLRRKRDRAVRHRHVPGRLCAHGQPLRFPHACATSSAARSR